MARKRNNSTTWQSSPPDRDERVSDVQMINHLAGDVDYVRVAV